MLFESYTPPPVGVAYLCSFVCLSVCSRAYLRNFTSDRRQMLVRITNGRDFGGVGLAIRHRPTSASMDDGVFAHMSHIMLIQQHNVAHMCEYGSRVVSVLDSRAEGPGFKSQS